MVAPFALPVVDISAYLNDKNSKEALQTCSQVDNAQMSKGSGFFLIIINFVSHVKRANAF